MRYHLFLKSIGKAVKIAQTFFSNLAVWIYMSTSVSIIYIFWKYSSTSICWFAGKEHSSTYKLFNLRSMKPYFATKNKKNCFNALRIQIPMMNLEEDILIVSLKTCNLLVYQTLVALNIVAQKKMSKIPVCIKKRRG